MEIPTMISSLLLTSNHRLEGTKMTQPLALVSVIKECHEVFRDASNNPNPLHREWAENRLADFNLWCAGVNATGSGKSSLQARLATNTETQTFLNNLVNLLTALLKKYVGLANTTQEPSAQKHSNLSQAMEDVQDTLGQLTRVTLAIRKAGAMSRMQKADASFDKNNPQIQALRRHLEILLLARPSKNGTLEARVSNPGVILYSSTYANVEINSESLGGITKRLIEANLRRRNRFLYAQRHYEKLSNRDKTQESISQDTLMKPSRSHILSISARGREENGEPQRLESTTTATAIEETIVMPTQQSLKPTTTVISSTTSRVEYPKPPAFNVDQDIFQCPCCCQMLPAAVSRGSQWKKHIAEDILPYTCILDNCPCPEKLYQSQETWKSHMIADHDGISHWVCFACTTSKQHPRFDEKGDFVAHLNCEHAKGIKPQQIPILVSAWLRTSPVPIRSCPLCSYVHEDADVILSHTAQHVHSFSLISLPWASKEEGDPDVHGDYFQHNRYFNVDESTYASMQVSSTALDSDLPSIAFEPLPDQNHLTEEKLELLNENLDVNIDPANWLDSIPDENEYPSASTGSSLRLPSETIFNARQVRKIGACFRCVALRERCSTNTPCERCNSKRRGRWGACVRSFSELASYLIPDILAERLGSLSSTELLDKSAQSRNILLFPLPLSFGFGNEFVGLNATLAAKIVATKDLKHAFRERDGLPIYPCNATNVQAQDLLWQWLRQTCTDSVCIQQFLSACCPGERSEWLRNILITTWHSSVEQLSSGPNDDHVRDLLASAWSMALLSTMLSMPIKIPLDTRQRLFDRLQSLGYTNIDMMLSRDTSKVVTKIIKSLFFSNYQHFLEKVITALRDWDRGKVGDDPDHIQIAQTTHCSVILIMVVLCQTETHLFNDCRLSHARKMDFPFEERISQITEMDSVLKTINKYVLVQNERFIRRYRADEDISHGRYQAFLEKIVKIKEDYKEAIAMHRNVELETILDPSLEFHIPNMQRVFAWYLENGVNSRRS